MKTFVLHRSYPYVPITNWLTFITMCLKLNRSRAMSAVRRLTYVWSIAKYCSVALNKHSIMKNSNMCKSHQNSTGIKLGGSPNNVECLPFSGFPACINQWNRLLVNTTNLAVYISWIFIVIQYLQFISSRSPWKGC